MNISPGRSSLRISVARLIKQGEAAFIAPAARAAPHRRNQQRSRRFVRLEKERLMQLQPLTAGHGVLTAARTGQGRDIVALHSLLADRTAFDPVLPALAANHRVTLFNLPGFHGSEPVVTALLDAYVARIEDGFQ
jgi:hypothetical protein